MHIYIYTCMMYTYKQKPPTPEQPPKRPSSVMLYLSVLMTSIYNIYIYI